MKRLWRFASNGLIVVSALLCVATILLWARSSRTRDDWARLDYCEKPHIAIVGYLYTLQISSSKGALNKLKGNKLKGTNKLKGE